MLKVADHSPVDEDASALEGKLLPSCCLEHHAIPDAKSVLHRVLVEYPSHESLAEDSNRPSPRYWPRTESHNSPP